MKRRDFIKGALAVAAAPVACSGVSAAEKTFIEAGHRGANKQPLTFHGIPVVWDEIPRENRVFLMNQHLLDAAPEYVDRLNAHESEKRINGFLNGVWDQTIRAT